jgi:non-specific serine/threonine protein kinase
LRDYDGYRAPSAGRVLPVLFSGGYNSRTGGKIPREQQVPETPQPSEKNIVGDPGRTVGFSRASDGGLPANNLPLQLSSFVGREREKARVEELLADHRLLTLNGPGGSGKTRLALAVAPEVAQRFEDGVWLVELAPLSDPDLVGQAVASVLGMREAQDRALVDAICGHLSSTETLLILDNCEHLIDACASFAETLLRRCPKLRILATSREALGVYGETLFAVPPLSLPDPRHLPAVDGLPDYEAASLFAERARAVRPDFVLTEQNAMAVAQICYRLDGMPLAIELAAARARVISVQQISSRLEDSFALLSGGGRTAMPHHRTLLATMEWSHELLRQREKVLFRRLSVFTGGFALGAAEAVGAGEDVLEGEILDLLMSLVDKSLVVAWEREGRARYRLLETVRQYGRSRLEESGEAEDVSWRHATYYLALSEEVASESGGQGTRLQELETEQSNFRGALGWALGKERVEPEEVTAERATLGLRLAISLGVGRFWAANGLSEGLRWLETGLARSGDALPEPVRAVALNEAGWIATVQGDQEKAVVLLEESFALAKERGDKPGIAASLFQLGQLLVIYESPRQRVEDLRSEAEALRPEIPDPSQAAYLVMFMALASWYGDDDEQALSVFEEALGLFRELENLQGAAFCLGSIGFIVLGRDGPARAAPIFAEALQTLRTLRDVVGIFHCLLGAASVAGLRGEPDRAARLWGAAEALGETAAVPVVPLIRSHYDYESHLERVRSLLTGEAWAEAWAEGRAMSPEQAIEYALEPPLETSEETEAPETSYPADLSAREVEVLRLVARGMTNAQVAKELYISPRTVNAHMGSVYHKIGSSTRPEATRFAIEHDLL